MQAVTITQITPPELETLFENSLKKFLSSQKPEHPQPETDQLLTIQQVAELLSLSVPTIYGLVSRLEIPCMKKGKRLYFSKDEIRSWIKTGRKKTLAETASEAETYLKKKGGRNA